MYSKRSTLSSFHSTCGKDGPFSILCDEGNGTDNKYFAILVRLWDERVNMPATRFLDMPICNIANAENLFHHIDEALTKRNIPWSNVVGFESDTCNVMIGRHNSVYSRVKQKQSKVFSIGCVCHLASLCLAAGIKALPLDDFFVDLYYFFDKSAKRKEEFREFQSFVGVKELKIIKHCPTRWLSLERVIKRLLQQWDALYAYFDKEAESNQAARVLRLDNHLKSLKTKLYFLFLDYALDFICKFNATFQSSLPMLPSLQAEVTRLIRIFLSRFLTVEAVKASEENLSHINLDDDRLYLKDENLSIGHKTWAFLSEEDSIESSLKKSFFAGVRSFYKAVASTILKKFSFNDHVLKDLSILMPENKDKLATSSVLRLASRFSIAVPEDEIDNLEEEVMDYVLTPSSLLPSVVIEEGKPTENTELCSYWQGMANMKTINGIIRFPLLTKLAKCLLSLPHTERVFSIVRKIITDYRTEMEQSTLCALVASKLNNDSTCFDLTPTKELLTQAKSSTMDYNKAHSHTVMHVNTN